MTAGEIIFREFCAADMAGIFHVRTSVTENLIRAEQLERMGITLSSITASLEADSKGWVAEADGNIVGFSIADRGNEFMFALFILPGYERRGLGGRLLDLAVEWLWEAGVEKIWLTTAPNTRAARFYRNRGWVSPGVEPNGELRFELRHNP